MLNFPHTAKHRHLFVLAAGGVGGIIESPVVAGGLAGKDRTRPVRIIANRNHGIEIHGEERFDRLGGMAGQVDPDLLHHLDLEIALVGPVEVQRLDAL